MNLLIILLWNFVRKFVWF